MTSYCFNVPLLSKNTNQLLTGRSQNGAPAFDWAQMSMNCLLTAASKSFLVTFTVQDFDLSIMVFLYRTIQAFYLFSIGADI